MADLEKLLAAFKTATKQYVDGKIKFKDLQGALRKLEAAAEKMGRPLDFRDIDHYIEKRMKAFSAKIADSKVDAMSKSTWKAIKKEAGIKSSGFLKKADANVGSHLEKYGKAHAAWKASAVISEGGDHLLLAKAFSAGSDLKKALQAFVGAKEFMTDLAKELRVKCQDFINALEDELKVMAALSKEAHDPTAGLTAINNLGFAQFKVG